jgi:hypothetical protein
VRLSEELARIVAGGRRKQRRPADRAPQEIVPSERPTADGRGDPFDAARERLRSQIPPRDEE